jgi:dipicolinate synthase subunit A
VSEVIAVLGGDARDLHVAERLAELGHEVRVSGLERLPGSPSVEYSPTPQQAVAGANWLVCPAPGVDGDRLYAPFAARPVVLDRELLETSEIVRGGLILGRASATVREEQARMGFRLVETKDERHMAIANATSVAEGLLRLLIERTDRNLREYRTAVVGYGATGAAITDMLLALRCRTVVVARNKQQLERARQLGAEAASYEGRAETFASCDIVLNTVPATDAIPASAFPRLGDTLVVDIASPPGGMDHDAAAANGVDVVWARGLGSRAPRSSGDIRFDFVKDVLHRSDGHGQAAAG